MWVLKRGMRLHDAVRYAIYVSSAIGGAGTSRFGAQRKITLSHFFKERDMRFVLQNAALDVLVRVLNFGFDGSAAFRTTHNLIGRGAVLSLMLRIMGSAQTSDGDIYGYPEGAKGARSQLADLIARLWKYMRMVHQRDLDPKTEATSLSNGLVGAVKMLLKKFYVGAHLQKELQYKGKPVLKPRLGVSEYAEKKKLWDEYIEPLAVPHNQEFERLYNSQMGLVIAPKARRSKTDQDDQGEPRAKKRRSSGAVHVTTYDHLVASVVYDACMIGSLLGGNRTLNVALGAEPVSAILTAMGGISDSRERNDEALGEFLLRSVMENDRRGAANLWVVWCGDFSIGGNLASATPPPAMVYMDKGTDVSATKFKASPPGSESPRIPGDVTHVVFVVDARVVPEWEAAVKFWKNSRGLNFLHEEVECTWMTVILASGNLHPPANTVVIGTVAVQPAGLTATSIECEHTRQPLRKELAMRTIRTYDTELVVANLIRIDVGDDTALAALANLKCTSVRVKADDDGVTAISAKYPMSVVDVRRVAVTANNIAHFVALGTTRNYTMLTTKVQHDNIVGFAQSARAPTPAPQTSAPVYNRPALAQGGPPRNLPTWMLSSPEADGQPAPEPVAQKKIPKKGAELAMEQAGGATGGKGGAPGFDELRDAAFEPETVSILKKPVRYMVSVECDMARNEALRAALTGRKAIVTFLRVKSDPTSQGPLRHHAAVMRKLPKKQAIHGTLFYVECTANGEVSFEIASGGSVQGAPTVSTTMGGADLGKQLEAAEERHKKNKKSAKAGAKVHAPHVFVLCR